MAKAEEKKQKPAKVTKATSKKEVKSNEAAIAGESTEELTKIKEAISERVKFAKKNFGQMLSENASLQTKFDKIEEKFQKES